MFRKGVHGPTAELRPQATGAQVRSTCESLEQTGVQRAKITNVTSAWRWSQEDSVIDQVLLKTHCMTAEAAVSHIPQKLYVFMSIVQLLRGLNLVELAV